MGQFDRMLSSAAIQGMDGPPAYPQKKPMNAFELRRLFQDATPADPPEEEYGWGDMLKDNAIGLGLMGVGGAAALQVGGRVPGMRNMVLRGMMDKINQARSAGTLKKPDAAASLIRGAQTMRTGRLTAQKATTGAARGKKNALGYTEDAMRNLARNLAGRG